MRDDTRPQLVFHIGDPKTGTSSIQRALFDGAVRCPTRRILPWTAMNAIGFATALAPGGAAAARAGKFAELGRWLETGQGADVAVVSSEFFSRIAPAALRAPLERHLPDHAAAMRVLAYVRPHASRYLAAFVQRTKTGQYFGDVERFLDDLGPNDPLAYAPRFGRWRRQFGPRFTLRPFLRAELRGGDAVTDFFAEILGEAPFEIDAIAEENVSVSVRALAGLRRLHEGLRDAGVPEDARAGVGMAMANHFLPATGGGAGDRPRLDRQTAARLAAAYRADAEALDRAFFGRPLMAAALEEARNAPEPAPFDLTPGRHFGPAPLAELDRLAGAIAPRLIAHRKVWKMHYNVLRQNLRPSLAQRGVLAGQRRALDRIDADLAALAALIGGPG